MEYFEPPVADTSMPAMMAVYNPIWGSTPDAMAKAIASGNPTIAVITPALRSLVNDPLRYSKTLFCISM
jgi:isocitrate/isopropylmalate dehydrogenase